MCDKVVFERDGFTCSVDVTKRHACHSNARSMLPSATPATQSDGRYCQVPRMPRKVKVDVTKCRPATQSEGRCRQVPHLPRKVEVDVAKCHGCHANSRGDNGVHSEPSAPPEPAQYRKCHACHAECTSMSHLPRKVKAGVAKCHAHANKRQRRPLGTKRATRASPMP